MAGSGENGNEPLGKAKNAGNFLNSRVFYFVYQERLLHAPFIVPCKVNA